MYTVNSIGFRYLWFFFLTVTIRVIWVTFHPGSSLVYGWRIIGSATFVSAKVQFSSERWTLVQSNRKFVYPNMVGVVRYLLGKQPMLYGAVRGRRRRRRRRRRVIGAGRVVTINESFGFRADDYGSATVFKNGRHESRWPYTKHGRTTGNDDIVVINGGHSDDRTGRPAGRNGMVPDRAGRLPDRRMAKMRLPKRGQDIHTLGRLRRLSDNQRRAFSQDSRQNDRFANVRITVDKCIPLRAFETGREFSHLTIFV